ncbi:MAG: VCBS repeat-containing protein [Polyangiales bacterium]
MRARSATLLALSAVACVRAATPPPPTPPRPASPPPAAVVASAPSTPPRTPEADPAEFRADTREVDVDGDGLLDRVRGLPAFESTSGDGPFRATDDPVVVAHRLADGRFAVDDEVTRAVLRAACPAMTYEPPPSDEVPEDGLPKLTGLFWAGFCVRAWGGSVDAAERAVRAFTANPYAGTCEPAEVDAAIRAVREAVVPLTLRPIAARALRGWRPTPDPQEPPAFITLPPEAPPEPRCASVDAHNRARVLPVNRRAAASHRAHSLPYDPPAVALRPGDHCVATAAATWSLRAGAARFFTAESEPTVTVTFALTWAPTAGPVASLDAPFVAEQHDRYGVGPSLAAAFDWDDDGAPEVAVRERHRQIEGPTESPVRVFTVRDGGVRPFAIPSATTPCDAVGDVDADGRPDLVLRSPWRAVSRSGQFDSPHDGPTLVAHALHGGALSLRDEVARAWVARQCARAEHQRMGTAVDVVDIACARAWGQPPEEAVAAAYDVLRAARRRDPVDVARDEERLSFRAIAATAAVTAPFEPLREGLPMLPPVALR